MALHTKWSSGDLIFYDGTQDIFRIKNSTGGIVEGEDGYGLDYKYYGNSTGAYLLWDASADTLIFAGGAKITNDVTTTSLTTGTTGLLSLTTASNRTQFIASATGAASKITLPPTADCAGIEFMIFNTGTSGVMTVQTTGTSAVVIIPVLGSGIASCDGTSWGGLAGLGSTY